MTIKSIAIFAAAIVSKRFQTKAFVNPPTKNLYLWRSVGAAQWLSLPMKATFSQENENLSTNGSVQCDSGLTSAVDLEDDSGVFGQRYVRENPDLLFSSLAALEAELRKIPARKKSGWERALRLCPGLTGEKHRIQFLRSEEFNAKEAAKKMVKYWDKRIEIFGDEKAFEALTLDGALRDDEIALSRGVWRVAGRDNSGRLIIFAEPARHDKKLYDFLSMTRANWYLISAVLEDEETQRRGVIFIVNPKNVKFSQLDTRLFRMSLGSEVLPVRIAAFHICNPPEVFRIVLSMIGRFLGEKNRARLQVHSGSEDEVMEELVSQGIGKGSIPTEIGGEFEIDHVNWLAKRQEIGL